MLRFAVGTLCLPPSEFWALSLAEWLALVVTATDAGLGRAELDALIDSYPDQTEVRS
ncbi:MAG: phage tail assembly chaperone [Pseudomonadota bacterium]